MDNIKRGNMGVPSEIDEWVNFFYNNTVSLISQFIKLGKTNNTLFYLDEEKEIESYGTTFENDQDFDSSILKDNNIKLKNLLIEIEICTIPQKYFSTSEWTAHYNDSSAELVGDTLYDSEIYFEFFIPEEILEVEEKDLAKYLLDSKLKAYIMEYISHELTHMYEFYLRKINNSDNNWVERRYNLVFNLMQDYLESIGMKYLSEDWIKLIHLIYVTYGFEINARIVQLYYRLNNLPFDINSYTIFKDNIKDTLINKEMEYMKKFNPIQWFEEFEYDKELADKYLSSQEWITTNMLSTINKKQLVLKSLILNLDYIIGNLNKMGENIKRIPKQYQKNPLLFIDYHNRRFKKSYSKLDNKITRLYNKFI